MIKKALIGSALLATLGTFVFGRDVLSYARTSASSVRDAVKSEVPVEFEVERAREMVENLVPDIRKCMHVIAEQQVEIEDLTDQIEEKTAALAKQQANIIALRGNLDSGESTFRYASRTYTSDDVRRDLATRFERFKLAKDTLAREEQILNARRDALAANQQKLDEMLVQKQDLVVQLEQLDARLKAVQAAETVSTLELDNTQLTRAKKLIRGLNKQLDIKEKMLDAEGKFTGLIPVDAEQTAPADIEQQIDAYFDGNTPKSKVIDLNEI